MATDLTKHWPRNKEKKSDPQIKHRSNQQAELHADSTGDGGLHHQPVQSSLYRFYIDPYTIL